MKSIMDKKGQVSSMGPAIIALVIAAVFLILGLVMVQNMRDTDVVKESQSASVSNEVVSAVGNVAKQLAGGRLYGGNSYVVSAVTNKTSGTAIPSTNYTVDSAAGTIRFTIGNSLGINGSDWNVTYTYKHGGEAYKNSNETLVGLGTFSDFWEIIVLAIVITIVIGLLLVVFGGRRNR